MQPLRRNPELERVILEDPLDPAAWLVYGDWLQAEGDPRGELVAVQARHARDPGNPVLMEAQRALFRLHGKALLEGLEHHLVARKPPDGRDVGPLFRLSWEFGFLWTATIARDGHSHEEFVAGVRALLAHPSAHFLHVLSLGAPPGADCQQLIPVLMDGGERPLRILLLGDSTLTSLGDPRPGSKPLGDLAGLWQALPHLQCLALRGGRMAVGTLELPALKELVIETSALQRETLAAIGAHSWPHLEKLEIWFGGRGCTTTFADLAPILDGSAFPRLRHLALRNCGFVDRICHSLANARIVRQLHVLDLSLGALTDAGVNGLLAARSALEHLAVLDLHHHYAHEALALTAGLARFVDVTGRVYSPDEDAPDHNPKVWDT